MYSQSSFSIVLTSIFPKNSHIFFFEILMFFFQKITGEGKVELHTHFFLNVFWNSDIFTKNKHIFSTNYKKKILKVKKSQSSENFAKNLTIVQKFWHFFRGSEIFSKSSEIFLLKFWNFYVEILTFFLNILTFFSKRSDFFLKVRKFFLQVLTLFLKILHFLSKFWHLSKSSAFFKKKFWKISPKFWHFS